MIMQIIGPYTAIIGISLVIILSYFFNIISQKTNIPSVLLLIVLGILAKQGMNMIELKVPESQLFNALELLGIIGLIMIVLEAALDLELTKEKWPTIWKSFSVALLSLFGSVAVLAYIIHFFLIDSVFTSILYAVPLSVMSSAIIIPSVGGLSTEKKEFMVYEGTFSDILGIMLFYFLTGNAETESTQLIILDVVTNIGITVILSLIISYALVLIFQKLNSNVKLFLLIAVLLMLYSVGKLFHLSSLIIILVFGLVLNNYKIFFRGFMKKWINKNSLKKVSHEFHIVTIESAFVVRTFFFVLFGITITLQSLLNKKVALISLLILLGLYVIRFITLKLFVQRDILPQLFLAPRGLITILLFFAIPTEFQVDNFDSGILLYTIIISCIIMAVSLVASGKRIEPVEDMSFIYGPKMENEVESMPVVEQNSEKKDDLIDEK